MLTRYVFLSDYSKMVRRFVGNGILLALLIVNKLHKHENCLRNGLTNSLSIWWWELL